MQGFVKVLVGEAKFETQYFHIDDGHSQLRIGASKQDALGSSALVLKLDEISDAVRSSPDTVAVTSKSIPVPLEFKVSTANQADIWIAHLKRTHTQTTGLTSSEAKKRPVNVVISKSESKNVDGTNSNISPSNVFRMNSPKGIRSYMGSDLASPRGSNLAIVGSSLGMKITYVVMLATIIAILAATYKLLGTAPSTNVIKPVSVPQTSQSIGLFGVLGWILVIGSFFLGVLAALLADKLHRDRGKLTQRFASDDLGFSLVDHPEQGVIVDEVEETCASVLHGVRLKGARVRRVGANFYVGKKKTTAQQVREAIQNIKERPLVVVFQTDDQMVIDGISETFSKRMAMGFLGFSAVYYALFRSWMYPQELARFAVIPAKSAVWSGTTILLWSIVGIGLVVGIYLFVRSFADKAEKRRAEQLSDDARLAAEYAKREEGNTDFKIESEAALAVDSSSQILPAGNSMQSNPEQNVARPGPFLNNQTQGHTGASVINNAASPPTTTKTIVSTASMMSTDAGTLEKYAAMRRQGLSEVAVRIAMNKDGIIAPPDFFKMVDATMPTQVPKPVSPVPSQISTQSKPMGQVPAKPLQVQSTGGLDPKYQKMLDMGLSKVTVASAMRKDGIDPPF